MTKTPHATKITHAEVHRLFVPGRAALIKYHNPDVAQRGIEWAQGGGPEHVLCLLGGFETVEADVTGIAFGNVRNYLDGECDIIIKEPRFVRTHADEEKIERYWVDKAQLKQPYDFGMIAGLAPILLARKMVYPFSHPAGRWILRNATNALASDVLSTCAELYARGQRQADTLFLKGYSGGSITPFLLDHDARDLVHVRTLTRPMLAGVR